MKHKDANRMRPVKDWNIKICDFGLARSLVGVTSANIITDAFGEKVSAHEYETEKEISLPTNDVDFEMKIEDEKMLP
jgi:hypothetical protein